MLELEVDARKPLNFTLRLARQNVMTSPTSLAPSTRVPETQFGYVVNDKVSWRSSDADISTGEVGTVVGFTADRVTVRFVKGTWRFKPDQLTKARPERLVPSTTDQTCLSAMCQQFL